MQRGSFKAEGKFLKIDLSIRERQARIGRGAISKAESSIGRIVKSGLKLNKA